MPSCGATTRTSGEELMIETVTKSLKMSKGNDFCSVGLMTTLGSIRTML